MAGTLELTDKLFNAVERSDVQAVKHWMCKGANVNLLTSCGRTVLGYAAQHGQLEIARLLLQSGTHCSPSSQPSPALGVLMRSIRDACNAEARDGQQSQDENQGEVTGKDDCAAASAALLVNQREPYFTVPVEVKQSVADLGAAGPSPLRELALLNIISLSFEQDGKSNKPPDDAHEPSMAGGATVKEQHEEPNQPSNQGSTGCLSVFAPPAEPPAIPERSKPPNIGYFVMEHQEEEEDIPAHDEPPKNCARHLLGVTGSLSTSSCSHHEEQAGPSSAVDIQLGCRASPSNTDTASTHDSRLQSFSVRSSENDSQISSKSNISSHTSNSYQSTSRRPNDGPSSGDKLVCSASAPSFACAASSSACAASSSACAASSSACAASSSACAASSSACAASSSACTASSSACTASSSACTASFVSDSEPGGGSYSACSSSSSSEDSSRSDSDQSHGSLSRRHRKARTLTKRYVKRRVGRRSPAESCACSLPREATVDSSAPRHDDSSWTSQDHASHGPSSSSSRGVSGWSVAQWYHSRWGMELREHYQQAGLPWPWRLNNACDYDLLDTEGNAPLHYAAAGGLEDMVRLLVLAGASVDVTSTMEQTPLHLAAQCGSVAVAQLLIEHGACVNAVDRLRHSPLHEAALCGHQDLLELLLERGSALESRDCFQRSPLMLAVENLSIVKLLISKGANINVQDMDGKTPLSVAIEYDYNVVAELLLRAGATAPRSNYLLHYLVKEDNAELLRLLSDTGQPLNLRDLDGETPLILAARSCKDELVQILLDRGANPNARNGLTGETALHAAVEGCYSPHRDECRFETVFKQLMAAGAHLSVGAQRQKDTPLFRGVLHQKLHAVKLFIRHGCSVKNSSPVLGMDLLHLAVYSNNRQMAMLLVQAGCPLYPCTWLDNPHQYPAGSLHATLAKLRSAPMRLGDLCRVAVRNLLGERLVKSAPLLPLPPLLRRSLLIVGGPDLDLPDS